MTAARQKRKRFYAGCVAAAGVLLLASAGLRLAMAATTERIVVGWHSALAFGG
jgi:hypothetical protein